MADNAVTEVLGLCDELLFRKDVELLREELVVQSVEKMCPWGYLKWKVVGVV